MNCSLKLNNTSKTAEFGISGNLSKFTGKMFSIYIYDDSDNKLGNGGILLSSANSFYASRSIELSRIVQDGEICYFNCYELYFLLSTFLQQ